MGDLTLVLEASSGAGSVALLRGGTLVAETEIAMRGHDGERLMPAVVRLLGEQGGSTTALARITCGAGPGGFTSLRIAAALAKGLAYSLGIELWAASSLALLAAGDLALGDGRGGREPGEEPAADGAEEAVIAAIDALRGEWYCQRFVRGAEGAIAADGGPGLMGHEALATLAAQSGARIVGMGADAFAGGRHAVPLARHAARLAPGPLLAPVALDSWEPDYGRLAEAQVKWEKAHGRALGAAG